MDAGADERSSAPGGAPATYAEIVVGVDPPAKSGAKADECGVVVTRAPRAGSSTCSPICRARATRRAAGRRASSPPSAAFAANEMTAEINNGGEMVEAVLRQSDADLPVRNVTATRGKSLRAQPVAAAYERGIVFHRRVREARGPTLRADARYDSRAAGFSPDRADALVWAVADLLGLDGGAQGMMAFMPRGEGEWRILCRDERRAYPHAHLRPLARSARRRMRPAPSIGRHARRARAHLRRLELPRRRFVQRRAELAVEGDRRRIAR